MGGWRKEGKGKAGVGSGVERLARRSGRPG